MGDSDRLAFRECSLHVGSKSGDQVILKNRHLKSNFMGGSRKL